MTNQGVIRTVLRVEPENFESLLKGQAIAAISQTFIRPGQSFLICPASDDLKQEIEVDVWFDCQSCYALDDPNSVDKTSFLTALDPEKLKEILLIKGHLFVVKVRGYWLPQPVNCSLNFNGQFAALDKSLSVDTALPLISDQAFEEKDKLKSPKHPELEELYLEISRQLRPNLATNGLLRDIQIFLGCLSPQVAPDPFNSGLNWIKTIVSLGDRTLEEEDQKKSNYQAGTDFENIARRSLEFLGFSINVAHKGGAGGLDLFCSDPYPLVVECKAGKRIPSGTTEELIKLGGIHLGTDKFFTSAKLIIGPGNPTSDVLKAATEFKVSIMSPKALQKLVEIQAKYPNSIDLVKLREYLKPGVIDSHIDEYIEKEVLKKLRFYSCILSAITNYFKQNSVSEVGTKDAIKICRDAISSRNLSDKELHDVLIELSSPFAGYLGREKALDGNWVHDRFYFLRDMPDVDLSQS